MNRCISFIYEGIRYFSTIQDDYTHSVFPEGNAITVGEAISSGGVTSALSSPWKLRNPMGIPVLSDDVTVTKVAEKTFEVSGSIEVDGKMCLVSMTADGLEWVVDETEEPAPVVEEPATTEAEEPSVEEEKPAKQAIAEEAEEKVEAETEAETPATESVEETKQEVQETEQAVQETEPEPAADVPSEDAQTEEKEEAVEQSKEETPEAAHTIHPVREPLLIGGGSVPAISRGTPSRGIKRTFTRQSFSGVNVQEISTPVKEPTYVGKFVKGVVEAAQQKKPVVREEPKPEVKEEPIPVREEPKHEYRYCDDIPKREESKTEEVEAPKVESLRGREILGDAVPEVDKTTAARSPMLSNSNLEEFYNKLTDAQREVLSKIPMECMKGNITEATSLDIPTKELLRLGNSYCISNKWHVYGEWYYIDVTHHMSRFFFNEKEGVCQEIPLSIFKKWRRYKELQTGDVNE